MQSDLLEKTNIVDDELKILKQQFVTGSTEVNREKLTITNKQKSLLKFFSGFTYNLGTGILPRSPGQ